MKSNNLANWIQVLTAFAVLLGLSLVVWELQQNRDLVRAQLANDGFLSHSDTQRTFLGESFAYTFAKACFEPEELSNAELVQMTAYGEHLLTEVARAKSYSEIGEHPFDWRILAQGRVKRWLSTKAGRADYVSLKEAEVLQPWVVETAEDLLSRYEIEPCTKIYNRYFQLVRADVDPLLR
ncbi:MAG: hypothetical protein E2O59_12410 [Gammaproteobacteria bacterium]|nr:MAG: hypothetical protein E2O59_12410 [Gammaproteobacteria bacterium]